MEKQQGKAAKKFRYVVVSYDPDQQQWFWDVVRAVDSDAAEELICRIRPYVIAADAATLAETSGMLQRFARKTVKEIRADLQRFADESGVATQPEKISDTAKEARAGLIPDAVVIP